MKTPKASKVSADVENRRGAPPLNPLTELARALEQWGWGMGWEFPGIPLPPGVPKPAGWPSDAVVNPPEPPVGTAPTPRPLPEPGPVATAHKRKHERAESERAAESYLRWHRQGEPKPTPTPESVRRERLYRMAVEAGLIPLWPPSARKKQGRKK